RPASQEPVHKNEGEPAPSAPFVGSGANEPASPSPSAGAGGGTAGSLPRRPTAISPDGAATPTPPAASRPASPPASAEARVPRPVDADGKPALPTRRPGSSFRADAEPALSSAVSTRGGGRDPQRPRGVPAESDCPQARRRQRLERSRRKERHVTSGAANLNWLIERFANNVPSIKQAVVVSSDGLAMAVSEGTDRETADRLSAVASGMIALAYGSAGRFGAG